MNIIDLARPNIVKLQPYSSARSENSSGILLDANENSIGSVVENYPVDDLNRYPDPNQKAVRIKLGEYLNLPYENLYCGVGSDEIIDLLIRIFCEPGRDNAIIVEPTYGMYKVACDINDAAVKSVNLSDDFQIDVPKTLSSADANSKLMFLCSPNNPTGNLLNKEDILSLVRGFNGIVAVDEAYIEFNEKGSVINEVLNYPNLVVLRTFSKAWGLAGARCGYLAADESVISLIFKIKAPYNLNRLTSGIIIEALDKKEKKEIFVSMINLEKERIIEKMASLKGIEKIFTSDANFILFRCSNSDNVYKYLLEKGIVIRDRSSHPMLKGCLRMSVGTRHENDLFLTALWRALCEIS